MSQKKQCRVCGKDYEPCHSHAPQNGVFRWREVACSPDCGAIYLRRIQESRGLIPKETKKPRSKKVEVRPVEIEIVAESEVEANTLEPNRD